MNKGLLAAAVIGATSLLSAAPLLDKAFYSLENVPNTLDGSVRPGADIEFRIEENATTGYMWSAQYDPKNCEVELEHKPSKSGAVGAPGYVNVEIEPLTAKPGTVILTYARSFEPQKPVKTVTCVVTPQTGNTCAPEQKNVNKIPPEVGILREDSFNRLDDLPSALRATVELDDDLEFDLQEFPDRGKIWAVDKFDSSLSSVGIKHTTRRKRQHKAEIEIKPRTVGCTYIDFRCGKGDEVKNFRLYLNFVNK